jgi:hypothetical protein
MYRPMRLLLWAGIALLGAACVKGDIVVPALGPDDSYSPVDGRGTTASGEAAFPFRVPPDANFLFGGAIALSEFGATSATNIADVRLATDVSGAPGSVLASFHLVDVLPLSGENNSPAMVSAVLGPILLAGKNYWLIAAPSDSGIEIDLRY